MDEDTKVSIKRSGFATGWFTEHKSRASRESICEAFNGQIDGAERTIPGSFVFQGPCPLNTGHRLRPLLSLAGALLLVIGFVSRVAPLADAEGRLLRQWPTEDGYLMLTIARNMALGNGMSTSDGEIPTNGTQPLATGIWSLAFLAVDGDKKAGVTIVLYLELAFSLLAVFLLYQLAARVYARTGVDPGWSWLTAGAWYASSLVVPHSMNSLESGLYGLLVLAAADVYQRAGVLDESGRIRFDWKAVGLLAVVLSLAFWARNDAVFLIAAFCVSCLLGLRRRPGLDLANLPKVLVAGSLTVAFASPWLISNVVNFGHLMPISGVAQSASATVGNNAYLVPLVWLEYLSVFLPVPHSLEANVAVTGVLTLGLVLVLGVGLWYAAKLPAQLRHFAVFIGLYALALTVYYGLLHGAPWFMARYLYPVSPFIAMVSIGVIATLVSSATLQRVALPVVAGGIALMLAVDVGLNLRLYRSGNQHMHQQVVHWVHANVRPSDWIGAVQTGTLGFFHDRTVNLDGKVNPEALEAVIADTIPSYVNEKGLVVLADWYGIHNWVELPEIKGKFEVLAADETANLGVLGRRGWMPKPAGSAQPLPQL